MIVALCRRWVIVAKLAWPIHAAVEVTSARSNLHRLTLRRLSIFLRSVGADGRRKSRATVGE